MSCPLEEFTGTWKILHTSWTHSFERKSKLRQRLNGIAVLDERLELHPFYYRLERFIEFWVVRNNATEFSHLSISIDDHEGRDLSFERSVRNGWPLWRLSRQQVLANSSLVHHNCC